MCLCVCVYRLRIVARNNKIFGLELTCDYMRKRCGFIFYIFALVFGT